MRQGGTATIFGVDGVLLLHKQIDHRRSPDDPTEEPDGKPSSAAEQRRVQSGLAPERNQKKEAYKKENQKVTDAGLSVECQNEPPYAPHRIALSRETTAPFCRVFLVVTIIIVAPFAAIGPAFVCSWAGSSYMFFGVGMGKITWFEPGHEKFAMCRTWPDYC
jgi:hypothetical protein